MDQKYQQLQQAVQSHVEQLVREGNLLSPNKMVEVQIFIRERPSEVVTKIISLDEQQQPHEISEEEWKKLLELDTPRKGKVLLQKLYENKNLPQKAGDVADKGAVIDGLNAYFHAHNHLYRVCRSSKKEGEFWFDREVHLERVNSELSSYLPHVDGGPQRTLNIPRRAWNRKFKYVRPAVLNSVETDELLRYFQGIELTVLKDLMSSGNEPYLEERPEGLFEESVHIFWFNYESINETLKKITIAGKKLLILINKEGNERGSEYQLWEIEWPHTS